MSTREERLRAIDAAVWRTITDADWQRSLRLQRARVNPVSLRIKQEIKAREERMRGAQPSEILNPKITS